MKVLAKLKVDEDAGEAINVPSTYIRYRKKQFLYPYTTLERG